MPGASWRRTGSATRWNSFQPLFIRHGSDQPFSVTTGLYAGPVFGKSGGAISALSRSGASGSEAAPTRDTMVAPKNPAAVPARNFLREFIFSMPSGGRGAARRRAPHRLSGTGRTPSERHLQVGLGDPEVPQRLDVAVHGRDLFARIREKLENAGQHAVVAKQDLFRDPLAQWHDLIAVVLGQVERSAVGAVRFPHLRTSLDCGLERAANGLHVLPLGACDASTAEIEDRNPQLDLPAALPGQPGLSVAEHADLQQAHESRHLGEAERTAKRLGIASRALDIEPLRQGLCLQIVALANRLRKLRQAIGKLESEVFAP